MLTKRGQLLQRQTHHGDLPPVMRMLPGGSVTIYKALFVKVAAQILLMLLKVFPKSVAIAQLLKIEPLSSYNQCDILQMRKSQETQDSENLS